MNKDKIIEMIDTHLEEPHSISQDWVVALQTCKQALIEKDTIRAEAIKEFAERLKEKAISTFYEERKYIDTEDIDNLVEEMVGENSDR